MKTLRFQSLKHKPCHQNFSIKFKQLKKQIKDRSARDAG
jgi:hypothetical protein